ncbi:tetratricopeptide repeat protein [Sinorhizobium fredii]|uniref:Tetratricopeptide repeat-containing protein n=1 Tax=Rhizobium fredii TaxID=380 RepID=A0A2L0H7R0_RHIFR|nr:tetratricopeptide repeat protein [Sinorhizobium fredii]AUX77494.1 tetratricopeptide repeat-containing protein [Sinorhizobium fredii]
MFTEIIERIEDFENIRKTWDELYRNDPDSHPCLSWDWLRQYLPRQERWFILALRRPDDADYCAFLPLRVATYRDKTSGLFCDEILMIGNHGSGRAGLLCMPGLENEAADASASIIRRENWASLRFDYLDLASDRTERLLDAFADEQFIREDGGGGEDGSDICEQPVRCLLVKTRTGRNLRDCLNQRSIDFVFERAMELHSRGKLDAAETGYRQVIHAAPKHVYARYGLAQLCTERGDHAEAEHLYRGLLSAMPEADKIQHRLGDALMAQARYHEASETFEDLLARSAHLGLVRFKLAVCLLAAGQRDAAIATFLSFEGIASDDPEHLRCKLRSREAVSRLRLRSAMEEQRATKRTPQKPLAQAGRRSRETPAAPAIAVRLLPPAALLKPSVPAGVSAHLHARPIRIDPHGSKRRH